MSTSTTSVSPAVAFTVPGSKNQTAFRVTQTSDGKYLFNSDRTIGLYDPKKGQAWYSTRGNTPASLKNAREVVLPSDIVSALQSVAVPSPRASKKAAK